MLPRQVQLNRAPAMSEMHMVGGYVETRGDCGKILSPGAKKNVIGDLRAKQATRNQQT